MTDKPFALGTFDAGQGSYPGLVMDGMVHDIGAFTSYRSTMEILEDWNHAFATLAVSASDPPVPGVDERTLKNVASRSPRSGQLYAAGANYRTHIIEMAVDTSSARRG